MLRTLAGARDNDRRLGKPVFRVANIGWGATAEEQELTLAGEDADPAPYVTSTSAISMSTAAVRPRTVQMVQHRAGFYANTLLEDLFRSDIQSANTSPSGAARPALRDVVVWPARTTFSVWAGGQTRIVLLLARASGPHAVLIDHSRAVSTNRDAHLEKPFRIGKLAEQFGRSSPA